MTSPNELTLTQAAWRLVTLHAGETFPEECCGIILCDGTRDEIRRCTNIQNRLHALDPKTYPRTAAVAYAIDYRELESVFQEAQSSGADVKAFYHSHPGHEAYFSAEDKAYATPFGEPTYPESAQIVVSIYDGIVKEACAYAWNGQEKDFRQIPLRIVPPR